MFMYDNYGSSILADPIKNRQAETICDALIKIHNILKSRGSDPKVYIMENDCSSDLTEAMKKYIIDFQLAPLRMHRQNEVERFIRTCNNCLISVISATDPYFPISEWDLLLLQFLIILNLLCYSIVNPDISAYT